MVSLKQSLIPAKGGVVSLVGAGGKTSLMYRLAQELSEAGDRVLTTTTTRILMPTREQSLEVIVSPLREVVLKQSELQLKQNFHISAVSARLTSQNKLKGFSPEFIDNLWAAGLFRWILVEADGAAGRPLKAPAPHEPLIPLSSQWVIAVIGLNAVGKPLDEKWVFRSAVFAKITGMALGKPITPRTVAAALIHEDGIFRGSPSKAKQQLFLNRADCLGGLRTGREISKILRRSPSCKIRRMVIGNALNDPAVVEVCDINSKENQ